MIVINKQYWMNLILYDGSQVLIIFVQENLDWLWTFFRGKCLYQINYLDILDKKEVYISRNIRICILLYKIACGWQSIPTESTGIHCESSLTAQNDIIY